MRTAPQRQGGEEEALSLPERAAHGLERLERKRFQGLEMSPGP